jgi:pimeloyl-[acyl-carrier protein] synthase
MPPGNALMTKIKLDFSDPDFIANPYPTYQLIQENEPVYHDDNNVFYVTKFHDVVALLNNKNTSRRPPHHLTPMDEQKLAENDMDAFLMNWLIFQDPPKHSQMRNFFAKAINPNFIRARASTISTLAQHLLSALSEREQFDVVNEFAGPLSLAVVCDLSGFPAHESAFIKSYSDAITQNLDTGSADYVYRVQTLLPKLRVFFQEYITENKKSHQENFLSHVILNNAQLEEPLNETQVADATAFIVFSAHETTRLAISLSIKSLLENPEQINLLQQNPALFPLAVEECLRYETPFNKLSRWTTQALLIGETEIPNNALVVPLLNAANRDPEVFENPHQLIVQRNPVQNLAFGKGIHTCLGSVLGRLETEIALRHIVNSPIAYSTIVPEGIRWANITSLRYLSQFIVKK